MHAGYLVIQVSTCFWCWRLLTQWSPSWEATRCTCKVSGPGKPSCIWLADREESLAISGGDLEKPHCEELTHNEGKVKEWNFGVRTWGILNWGGVWLLAQPSWYQLSYLWTQTTTIFLFGLLASDDGNYHRLLERWFPNCSKYIDFPIIP